MTQIDIGIANKERTPVLVDLPALMAGRLLIQGVSGAGKSWLLRRLLEKAWGTIQEIVVDLEGEYASLADVFGHFIVEAAEVERVGAKALALKVREHRFSIIIDLSEAPRERQAELASQFLRGLVVAPEEHWRAALVVVDEAHLLAPLGASSGTPEHLRRETIASLTDLMARGRKRGLIGIIATQRLAKIAKSVVSECSNLIIGRNTLDLDVNRASDLLGLKRRSGERILRKLAPGHFVAVGPAVSAKPVIVEIGVVESEHTGKSPEVTQPPLIGADQALEILADMPDAEPEETTVTGGRQGSWTDEEIEVLGEGWANGTPRREIAAAVGHTVGACYQMAAKLGLNGPRVDNPSAWTPEEDEILRAGYAEGISKREMLARLPDPAKRSTSGIGWRAGELGLRMAPRNWTDEEIETLKRMHAEGASRNDIAAALERPRGGVDSQATKLGLHWLNPWRPDEYELLATRHAEGVRLVDIAREIGRPYMNVAKIAEKLGLRFRGQDNRQAGANKPVRISAEQLIEMVRRRHELIIKPKGGFILDGRASYTLEQLVALANRERTAAGEVPVAVAAQAQAAE